MAELLTAAQMRAIEQAAIDSGAVTGRALMERAGRGVVDAIFAEWPDLAAATRAERGPAPAPPGYLPLEEAERRRAVVLCGPGNNGGDGFVVARLLKEVGWLVEVFACGAPETLPPDAREQAVQWCAHNTVAPLTSADTATGERPDVLVDAMLGTGVSRPIPLDWAQAYRAVLKRAGKARCRTVAVDCPSGFDCDTGHTLIAVSQDAEPLAASVFNDIYSQILFCDLCVTFHRAKVGHYLSEATRNKRRPVVVDIGLPEGASIDDPAYDLGLIHDTDRVRLICPPADARHRSLKMWIGHIAFPFRNGHSHKYDRGHALVLAGGVGKGGAARLAARGALRCGAGLVTLGALAAAMAENAAQLNAIMLRQIECASALADVLTDDRITAVCMGPGLGIGSVTCDLVRTACEATRINHGREARRIILDADALSAFEGNEKAVFEMVHDKTVMTPHEGEFARLFPDLSEKTRMSDLSTPSMSRVDAVREAALRAGCTILLKGPATVIASPSGATSVHAALYDRTTGWLGTAGAGDVLAGMITGLCANPMASFNLHQLVEVAAYLHVEAARSFGPGLIAEDLPERLPQVLRDRGL